MSQTVRAIFENGVFRPTGPVNLPDRCEVELELRPVAPPAERHWREIRGSVAHPLFGEDAQAWVGRSRQESDERRPAGGSR
jgi:predicted DNA-binding antitoxin AbrB/MazE fold protein